MFEVHHIHAGQKPNRKQDVHSRAGGSNYKALPARMRCELVGGAGVRLERIFAGHLDVSTQRQRANAVVGVTAAEARQPLSEPDGEDVDSDPEQFGGGIVPKLVHQDHDPEHNCYPADVTYRR